MTARDVLLVRNALLIINSVARVLPALVGIWTTAERPRRETCIANPQLSRPKLGDGSHLLEERYRRLKRKVGSFRQNGPSSVLNLLFGNSNNQITVENGAPIPSIVGF